MTVRFALMLEPTDMLQPDMTRRASQAIRMPSFPCRVDDGAQNDEIAGGAEDPGTGGRRIWRGRWRCWSGTFRIACFQDTYRRYGVACRTVLRDILRHGYRRHRDLTIVGTSRWVDCDRRHTGQSAGRSRQRRFRLRNDDTGVTFVCRVEKGDGWNGNLPAIPKSVDRGVPHARRGDRSRFCRHLVV